MMKICEIDSVSSDFLDILVKIHKFLFIFFLGDYFAPTFFVEILASLVCSAYAKIVFWIDFQIFRSFELFFEGGVQKSDNFPEIVHFLDTSPSKNSEKTWKIWKSVQKMILAYAEHTKDARISIKNIGTK